MAKSVLDIVLKMVKQGSGDKQTIKGLVGIQSAYTNVLGVAGGVAAAAYTVAKAYDATVGVFVDYADEVRGVMQLTGLQADESSRLIQVADDLKISQEDLTKSLRFLADQGIEPNIESLAALSDEYQAMESPAARVQFLMDKFGKSGLAMAEAMAQGGDELKAMNAGIDDSLILTDDAVDMAREYQKALDALSEVQQGLAIQMGSELTPAATMYLEAILDGMEASREQVNMTQEQALAYARLNDALQKMKHQALDPATRGYIAWAEQLEATTPKIDVQIAATAELEAQKRLLAVALDGPLADAYDRYNETMADLETEHATLQADLEKLQRWGYLATSDKIRDATAALDENEQAQRDAAAAIDLATKKMIFQQVAASLDAGAQLELARQLGLVSEKDYAIVSALDTLKQKYDANRDGTVDAAEGADEYRQAVLDLTTAIEGLPEDQVINVVTNFVANGSPPGGFVYDDLLKEATGGKGMAGGGSFIVPPGYPNDSYPIRVESGERVSITPASDVRKGQAMPALQNYGTIEIHVADGSPQSAYDLLRQLGVMAS